jgi:hypothetical protein
MEESGVVDQLTSITRRLVADYGPPLRRLVVIAAAVSLLAGR